MNKPATKTMYEFLGEKGYTDKEKIDIAISDLAEDDKEILEKYPTISSIRIDDVQKQNQTKAKWYAISARISKKIDKMYPKTEMQKQKTLTIKKKTPDNAVSSSSTTLPQVQEQYKYLFKGNLKNIQEITEEVLEATRKFQDPNNLPSLKEILKIFASQPDVLKCFMDVMGITAEEMEEYIKNAVTFNAELNMFCTFANLREIDTVVQEVFKKIDDRKIQEAKVLKRKLDN